jgi:peptide/nickel transport system substrate-binding protein
MAQVKMQSWYGWRLLVALTILGAGCAGLAGQNPQVVSDGSDAPARSGPKSIAIVLPIDPTALGGSMQGLGAAAVPTRYFKEFPNAYLTTLDQHDEPVAWMATALPSLDDGTWKVVGDGRMEVTWKLRPGIKWQDGAELTADDLKFSWEIAKDPATQIAPNGTARLVEAVTVPDPHTAIFTWTEPSALGALAGAREFDVLPKHLLEDADRARLVDNHYFSDPAVFVGSGPYRPLSWERGSFLTLQAFDDYFLGRPKIDRVNFSFIPDTRTALANLMAGQVDIMWRVPSYDGARIVAEQWARTGDGTVDFQANTTRHLLPQLRPDYAAPRDLSDVRVRRALMHGMDRNELAEAVAPGAAQVVNSTTYPDSALGRIVEARALRYDYDPARAAALLAEAGWEKGADGMLSKAGERFRLLYRAGTAAADANLIFPVLELQYRKLGVDFALHQANSSDPQDEATFSGVWFTALPVNQTGFLSRFKGANIAGPQNRWSTSNRHGYLNPVADDLLGRIDRTLWREDRMALWAEANRILVDEVAYIPLYNFPYPYFVRKNVVGAMPGNPINPPTYFVHTWDVP